MYSPPLGIWLFSEYSKACVWKFQIIVSIPYSKNNFMLYEIWFLCVQKYSIHKNMPSAVYDALGMGIKGGEKYFWKFKG